jgi:hypothetical protein
LSKPQIQRTDKSKTDYEFERNEKECTFAPKVKSTFVSKGGPPAVVDKYTQKQIDRLNKAREEKERIQSFKQRGEPPAKQSEDH